MDLRRGIQAAVDAVVVDVLRKAGAVLYVKTANPQTLLVSMIWTQWCTHLLNRGLQQSLETNNNVFGRTLNPFNRNLTPGGSSGGESALIAMHGSPLGLGTDIGGSIVSNQFHAPMGQSNILAVLSASRPLIAASTA